MYAQLTCTGLIPADAGKTSRFGDFGGGLPVHPRSRRENLTENTRAGIEAGASPLTRGKRSCLASFTLSEGIIPAHAGKTTSPWPARPQ